MSESLDRASARNSPQELRRLELDAWQTELHTCLPATIISYDKDTKRASVQISPRRKHTQPIIENNNGNVSIPVLSDMPVHQPFAGRLFLGLEPKEGDECIVLFSEREIETLKNDAGEYDLAYARRHNLSDGLVIPFCISSSAANRVTGGVSLIECFQDLAGIVRDIASNSTPPNPQAAANTLALMQKLEAVL